MDETIPRINSCPNCDLSRKSGKACRGCGYRFDVGAGADTDPLSDGREPEHGTVAAAPAPVLSASPPPAMRSKEARPKLYAKRAGWVALGIFLGLILMQPNRAATIDDANASARSIKVRANADARHRATEIVDAAREEADAARSQAAADQKEYRATMSTLRKQGAALLRRKSALTRQSVALQRKVTTQQAELRRAREATATATAAATSARSASSSTSGSGCSSGYTGACLKEGVGDYDCAGGSGDGPNYTGTVSVVGYDEFDLDRDGDGVACDS